MGVMTGVQMFNMLLGVLGNRTTTDIPSATAVHWFNWTIDHLSSPKVFRHPELEDTTTQTMVTDQRTYTIAAATGVGTVAIDSVVIFDPANTQSRLRLGRIRARELHEMRLQSTSSQPTAYSRWSPTLIEVLPAPNATYAAWTLSIQRIKKPTLYISTDLTAGSVLSPYDGAWDAAIMQGAAWHGWIFLREWEKAEQAKREFGQLVNEATDRLSVEDEDVDYGPQVYLDEVM